MNFDLNYPKFAINLLKFKKGILNGYKLNGFTIRTLYIKKKNFNEKDFNKGNFIKI